MVEEVIVKWNRNIITQQESMSVRERSLYSQDFSDPGMYLKMQLLKELNENPVGLKARIIKMHDFIKSGTWLN